MSYPAGKYINVKYNPDELLDKFEEYAQYCEDNDKLANIAGFCRFAKIDPQTFANYGKNADYETVMRIISVIHEDTSLNSKQNPILKIFYMKNKFGYVDKKEIVNTSSDAPASIEDLNKKRMELFKDMSPEQRKMLAMMLMPTNETIDLSTPNNADTPQHIDESTK